MLLYFRCKGTFFILVTHQSILPTQSHIQKDSHIYTFPHSHIQKDSHIYTFTQSHIQKDSHINELTHSKRLTH